MERLKDLSQLSQGCNITLLKNGEMHCWEFLMVHPHNKNYILALDSWTQKGDKLYIPQLFEGNYYVGKYDRDFVLQERIKQLKHEISFLERRITRLEKGDEYA